MTWHILRLSAEVELPNGAAPGAGRDGSTSILARDGRGAPLLRGTALAGVLRSQWQRQFGRTESEARHWFGTAASDGSGQPSRVSVEDIRFADEPASTETRVHNLIDRHTGAPLEGGLFFVESIAPRAKSWLRIVVRAADGETDDAKRLLEEIMGLLSHGVTVGGSSSRGIGTLRIAHGGAQGGSSGAFRHFQLSELTDYGAWLDERRAQHAPQARPASSGAPLAPATIDRSLTIDLVLGIPPGQDWLVGGDSGLDAKLEPQLVIGAGGERLLRFPGSALRGMLRKWVSRLASREGRTVRDSHQRAMTDRADAKSTRGGELGWGFADKNERAALQADPSGIDCPVMSLFGSLYAKGRIHVADAVVPESRFGVDRRTHVSIDRFGGGASNGFLFDTKVVSGSGELPVRIEISRPLADDARWIAQSLKAIDLGVLRIGSSKAAGRFSVRVGRVHGPHADICTEILSKGASHHG
jgi:CRISPR/Cas system CSM-associated protein Csm3 (group 7 of RAMP superfamily)